MRIRKRAVPLPLSLISPDPHHRLVQLSSPPPSDPPDLRPPHGPSPTPQPQEPPKACEDAKMNKQQKHESGCSNLNISHAGAVPVRDNGVSLPLSHASSQPKAEVVEGRWCDGDKAIPLKKRKASLEMNGMVGAAGGGGYSKMMKSKTNKNCPLEKGGCRSDFDDDNDDDYEGEDDSESEEYGASKSSKRKRKRKGRKNNTSMGTGTKTIKKKKRGGSLMEGSRCSRVNGRGWRCMQPTLVGYSLCDHHLGKGRLRTLSTTVVKEAAAIPSPPPDSCNTVKPSLKHAEEESMVPDNHDIDDDDDSDSWKRCGSSGRKRIGMVKARSLSSLLCLPDTPPATKIGATSAPANQAT